MDDEPTSTTLGPGWASQVQDTAEAKSDQAPEPCAAGQRHHPTNPGDSVSAGEPASSDVHEAQSAEDVWDPDTWSGPAQALLTLVALVAPFVVWFIVVDHLPEAWADWAAIPILGLGDMIAAALFVFVYGSVRTVLRPLLERSSGPRHVGSHRG